MVVHRNNPGEIHSVFYSAIQTIFAYDIAWGNENGNVIVERKAQFLFIFSNFIGKIPFFSPLHFGQAFVANKFVSVSKAMHQYVCTIAAEFFF